MAIPLLVMHCLDSRDINEEPLSLHTYSGNPSEQNNWPRHRMTDDD